MGACNDCGAAVSSVKDLGDHYEKTHPGMPRYRFYDGIKETVVCPECGADVTPRVVRSDGVTPKTDWDYTVHIEQEKLKELRGQGSHGGDKK